MKAAKVYWTLIAVFLISLFLSIVLIAYAAINREIYWDNFRQLLSNLLVLYSVPCTIIVAGFLSHWKSMPATVSGHPAWVAIGVTVIWNLLVFGRVFMFTYFEDNTVGELSQYFDTVHAGGAFLVSGPLTFLFAKP